MSDRPTISLTLSLFGPVIGGVIFYDEADSPIYLRLDKWEHRRLGHPERITVTVEVADE